MALLIEMSDVVKEFPSVPPVRPLDGVTMSVDAGTVVAITGVSGKGKSTLLNVMGGLLAPDKGSVRFQGRELTRLSSAEVDAVHRNGIGFIFQTPHLFQALTARENLAMAQRAAQLPIDAEAVDAALRALGLDDRADHLPAELSVGQRRRLVLARAMLANHEVLLADEPTNDLDDEWSASVFAFFRGFVADGTRAVVMVTHDKTYASMADVIYHLEGGVLEEVEGELC